MEKPVTISDHEFRRAFGKAVSIRADELCDSDPDLAGAMNITSTRAIVTLTQFNEMGLGKVAKGVNAQRVTTELQAIYKRLKMEETAPQPQTL